MEEDLYRLFRAELVPDRDEQFAAAVRGEVARMRRRANFLLAIRLVGGLAVLLGLSFLFGQSRLLLADIGSMFGDWRVLAVPAPLFLMGLFSLGAFELRRHVDPLRRLIGRR